MTIFYFCMGMLFRENVFTVHIHLFGMKCISRFISSIYIYMFFICDDRLDHSQLHALERSETIRAQGYSVLYIKLIPFATLSHKLSIYNNSTE